VERLGGAIAIESEAGRGTAFRITLPLALATYRVLLLQVGEQILAVPTANADRVVRLQPTSIVRVDDRETITDRGAPILLQRLDRVLGLGAVRTGGGHGPVAAILRSGSRRVAFSVDRIL